MNAENLDPPAVHPADAGPAEKLHSPFWALLIVFLTLICLHVSYLADDLKQQAQIRSAQAQLNAPTVNAPMTQAKAIRQTTQGIGQELLALSAGSTEASNIVAEFNIKLSAPVPPAGIP